MNKERPFRPYQPADAATLMPIYNALHPRRPCTVAALRRKLDDVMAVNGRIWTITHRAAIAGYAAVTPLPGLPGLLDLSGGVAPTHRRQGVGSALLTHLRAALSGSDAHTLVCQVPSPDAPVAHFLLKRNFSLEHQEWQMQLTDLQTRSLAPSPQPPTPSYLNPIPHPTAVRTFPTLYNRSFRHTPWHQPFSAPEIATTLRAAHRLLYLVADDEPIGFVWLRFPTQKTAVIEPIGILREKQGQGYGRYLLHQTLHQLQTDGIDTVTLTVWANNHAAIHLYTQFGFTHRRAYTYLAGPIS